MPRQRRRSRRAGRGADGRTIVLVLVALTTSIVGGMLAGHYAVPDVTSFYAMPDIADAESRRAARAAAVLDAEIRDASINAYGAGDDYFTATGRLGAGEENAALP